MFTMTESQLHTLARQAAAGNETASWFLFCRLAKLIRMLDQNTLARIAEEVEARKQTLLAEPLNGSGLPRAAPSNGEAQGGDSHADVIRAMIERSRREHTDEVVAAVQSEIQDLREHGGYTMDEIIADLEKSLPPHDQSH
jgi:hypothetical protein